MNDDEPTNTPCPACGGSGKTRRFRLIPLVVAVAALLLIVLGELSKRRLGIDAASGGITAMPLKVVTDLSCLVFAGGMIAFFLRVQCPRCQGSGTGGDRPREALFTSQDDQPPLQRSKCRKCGCELDGHVSRRCPECGAPVLMI